MFLTSYKAQLQMFFVYFKPIGTVGHKKKKTEAKTENILR